uniref:F-box domain-containing protein n=1 Tax=Culex tarsalis TaxID=7177 RepID=A0A1Q3EWA0_CULTA
MEHCEICDQSCLPADNTCVPCSGPCGGTVHARCATFSGLTLTTVDGLFWFCDRCQRGLRPLAKANASSPVDLPELPTEMWIEVFQSLPAGMLAKVRLVCRRWRDIVAGCPTLLSKLTVSFRWSTEDRKFKPDHLLPVAKASFISIKGIGSWWHSYGPGLTEIAIEHFCMAPFHLIKLSDLLAMLKHTPNLKRFALIGCILTGKRSGRPDFHLNKLETLILEDILELGKYLRIFRKLFAPSPVKSLKIAWSENAGHTAAAEPSEMAQIVEDSEATLEELNINCSYIFLFEMMFLRELRLKKVTLANEDYEDKSRLLMEWFEMLPGLEFVDVSDMLVFSEDNASMLNEIGQLLPRLKFLSIYVAHVDVSFLCKIPNLQTFKLHGDEDTFKLIRSNECDEKLSNMRELHLWQVKIPNTWLATLPNLRTLNLTSCSIDSWSDFLDALESLQCLETLTLVMTSANATEPSPGTRRRSALPRLRQFKYESYDKATDDAFGELLAMCSELRDLELELVQLNDAILGAIFQHLRQLRKLIATGCGTSRAMESHIRQHCRSLEELKFG